jgi:O-antigen/teichoic acid export membrane protein
MNIRTSLLRNTVAGAWGKASSIILRLVQVPLLLSALGVEDYGRWLVLSSLPAWLTLANIGFGSVAANEMSMSVASGEINKARTVYSTTLALVLLILSVGSALTFLIAPFIPWHHVVSMPETRSAELQTAVICLAISVFVSFVGEVFGGRFRAARKAHTAVVISSFRPWIELASIVIVLQFSTRFDYLAIAMLMSTLVYTAVFHWTSRMAMPGITFSTREINKKDLQLLFKKGVAFQAFPLGNAMMFQGNLLIVQTILGPIAVALFATARTLVRSVNQLMEMVNQVIWPELSLLLGAGDFQRSARLHRFGVVVSFSSAIVSVLVLATFGHTLFEWWTGKAFNLPQQLLLVFLLPIPFNALWFTSSVVHAACNQHEGLASRYLLSCCLSVLACFILSYFVGIEGAALSTLVADLVLIPFVFKRSLHLTQDTWDEFFGGLWTECKAAHSKISNWVRFTN